MLDLSKGTQFADRYTLIRRLGGGGEAVIWLAKDRLTSASVALKICSSAPQAASRLRAEWQTGVRLMHPHIVRAFEFHTDADVAFYSQQFVAGPDIGVLTGQPAAEVLAPIGLIVDALRYLHAKGMVHRDVKASNILLDYTGAPFLSDFGVAAASGEVGAGGSPIAQSPQSLAAEPSRPGDDIFALGGLIYELIAGRPPYSSSATTDDIKTQVPAPLQAADGSELPQALIALVASMLDKNPGHRPDAESVAQQLQAAGYPSGIAHIKKGAREAMADEFVEAVESIRPAVRGAAMPSAAQGDASSGIRPRTALFSLAALLLVLVAVVFILPNRVSEKNGDRLDEMSSDSAVEDTLQDGTDTDPTRRRRLNQDELPKRVLKGEEITFSENTDDYSALDAEGRERFGAESALGELLSALEVLEGRGAERWAPIEHRKAKELYAKGDKAYLEKEFSRAESSYIDALEALQPLYERIEPTFQKAYADAQAAFEQGDRLEALRLFELAVSITPGHPGASAGYERAKNLEMVLRLVDQGHDYEEDLELEAAQRSYEQAIELDELWEPAIEGRERVAQTRTKMEFDARMTEGFEAIAVGDYLAARAAFRVAEGLIPESSEPADGLLQVDQGLRLQDISVLEQEVRSLERDEHWDAVVSTYEEILKVDATLSFATDGLRHAREMSALHEKLDKYIEEPDRLSVPSVMQKATLLVVDITTRENPGPRLTRQRDELSRLLKRAATPLAVPLVSDNVTQVSIYKVGRLGNFMRREVRLRPGTYVAVGIRPGYRDVRQEFRVAPEIDMQPVIVQCEEQI